MHTIIQNLQESWSVHQDSAGTVLGTGSEKSQRRGGGTLPEQTIWSVYSLSHEFEVERYDCFYGKVKTSIVPVSTYYKRKYRWKY